MTRLMGPEDPDAFRVSVGRARFYTDPLPACDLAPESDATYPSISRVKGAAKSDWSYVSTRRVAELATENDFRTLGGWTPDRRLQGMLGIQNHGLKIDSGRGTIIHWWGEDLLNGRPMRKVTEYDLTANDIPEAALEIALLYLDALEDFFRTYEPELYATEFVGIHRTLNGIGYGCTPDGFWYLKKNLPRGYEPGLYAFDYKSRGPGAKQQAYSDEAAQVAGGATCEYMIVRGADGEAVRQRVPELAGGMIVSIKPDGARVFPIDLEKAAADWRERHRWYVTRQTDRDGIGRVWPIKRATQQKEAA